MCESDLLFEESYKHLLALLINGIISSIYTKIWQTIFNLFQANFSFLHSLKTQKPLFYETLH